MQTQVEVARDPDFQAGISTPQVEPPARWNAALRFGFRFTFCYFILFFFPFPLGSIPYIEKVADWIELLWHKVVPWTAQHILRLSQPITIFTNGSGDTTYDYVKIFCFLIFALAAAILWSALDRRRENYQTLHRWLRLYIRVSLGAVLLGYGGFKVIPSQFPPVWQWRYLETYGNSSPMGLLWTFMSASRSYTIFAGAVEMLAGILLFVPRLAVLGALISIGAMTNVFILNMSYDVPVKVYSFHLLLLSIFLVLPSLQRLARFFVLNRATEPAPPEMVFRRPWINRGLLAAQLLLGLFFGGLALYQSHQQLKNFTVTLRIGPQLYGVWAVDEFISDGKPRPSLVTDETLWQKVVFENRNLFTVQQMNGEMVRMGATMDFNKKSLDLTSRTDPKWKASLAYELPSPGAMNIDGQLGPEKVHIKLHRTDPKYLLTTRGFHWITEFPLNR